MTKIKLTPASANYAELVKELKSKRYINDPTIDKFEAEIAAQKDEETVSGGQLAE